MQQRLWVSGFILALILAAGYGVMRFTSNEEVSQMALPEAAGSTNAAQKEAMTGAVDQASAPTTEAKVALTATEVAKHATEKDCFIIVNDTVYNVTGYIPRPPGGKGELVPLCGKDATSAFEGQHGGDRKPEMMLAQLKIGDLQK
jgi:cytochrome b involved in lipid metabolism